MGHTTSSHDATDVLLVHIFGALSIGIAGALGASAQLLTELYGQHNLSLAYYKRWLKMILTALGAGVVVATALLHILPDGMSSLSDSGINVDRTSQEYIDKQHGMLFDGVAAMHQRMQAREIRYLSKTHAMRTGSLGVGGGGEDSMLSPPLSSKKSSAQQSGSSSFIIRLRSGVSGVGLVLVLIGFIFTYIVESEVHAMASHAHSETIKTHIMEAGIATHSVLVGVAFGTLSSWDGARGLAIALTVHQLCEGFAMGPVIFKGARTLLHAVTLITIFALATPIGVIIGVSMGWMSGGGPLGEGTNFVQGVLSCIAAGLLLYVGVVEFLGGLLCTVHQDSWSHAVTGDADHVHDDAWRPTPVQLPHEGSVEALCLLPAAAIHPQHATTITLASYGSIDEVVVEQGRQQGGTEQSIEMKPVVGSVSTPPSKSEPESNTTDSSACSSRGRFIQTLPAGATFPRLQTPTLVRHEGRGSRWVSSPVLALDESTSLGGLSFASSPLMYSCSSGLCVHEGENGEERTPTFPRANSQMSTAATTCCSTDCSTEATHSHQHHHSHSGHQQRHHQHVDSCGHVADFHCAHPHIARLAISATVGIGAFIMALLAIIA